MRFVLSRFLAILIKICAVFSLVLVVLPLFLAIILDSFPGRNVLLAVFTIFAVEKNWSMFFRMPERVNAQPSADWSTVTVAYSYLVVMYASLIEFLTQANSPDLFFLLIAWGALAAAVGVRYWALYWLGSQWAVHVDGDIGERKLVRSGPFRWVRHPLYTGAIMECIAVSVMFGSFWGGVATVVLFIPSEIHRSRFEEKHLYRTFGKEYEEYKGVTRAFFPLPMTRRPAIDADKE